MDIKEMLDRKVQWKTEDDAILGNSTGLHRGNDFSKIVLEAQRIRVFNVEYTVKTESPLFM
jgi:hypothetical protein